MNDNHYDVLGVDPAASRDELRDAYRARVDDLTAAREKKGITESQLQDNRAEVARVRSAWNVLSDPFQRKRYDAQESSDGGGDEIDLVEGDVPDTSERAEVQLTGWRRFMAPPPKATPASGGGNGSGSTTATGRPRREPTITLPPGMRIAESRVRGMALLFDVAVLLVILYAVQFVVPNLVQSDYKDTVDQIEQYDNAATAQGEINDANTSINDANKAIAKAQGNGDSDASAQDDLKSAQSDKKDAQKDFNDAAKELNDDGIANVPHNQKQLEKRSDALSSDIRGTQYITAFVTLVFAMLYLVPITAKTGRTLGMRSRKIKVVRVDGSPVGWYPAFARFVIPVLVALAIPTLGPIVGLGIVLWGYRDPNGQGVHDKLARTLVVEA